MTNIVDFRHAARMEGLSMRAKLLSLREHRHSLVVLRSQPGHSAVPHTGALKARACGLAVFLLLWATPVVAQIDGPAESEPYKLIVSKLTTPIPEGAYLADGGWEVIGASSTVTADVREYGGEIVWTGNPGTYSVVFDGVLLKDITFKDGDGNQVTIKSYLGRIKARASCVIKGGAPPVVNPYKPAPAYQAAVEPVKKIRLSQTDSLALANMYATTAAQARAGGYTSMSQIRSDLVKRGMPLNLKGKYSGLSTAVEQYLSTCLGLAETVPVASVGDVFETLAWGVWETGRG